MQGGERNATHSNDGSVSHGLKGNTRVNRNESEGNKYYQHLDDIRKRYQHELEVSDKNDKAKKKKLEYKNNRRNNKKTNQQQQQLQQQ